MSGAPVPPPVPPNQAYQYGPPPPLNSGNTVLKIVLIVVGVFVLIGAIGAAIIGFGVYRVAKSAHRDSNGNVSISTPNGTITTGKSVNLTAEDLGVDPYPGAVTSSEGSMNMKTSTGSMVTAVFTSPDSADKIVAFYKDKLGDQASVVQSSNGTVLSKGDNDKDKVMVTVNPQGNTSKIVIIHIAKTKS
jgi:hypothetical protein